MSKRKLEATRANAEKAATKSRPGRSGYGRRPASKADRTRPMLIGAGALVAVVAIAVAVFLVFQGDDDSAPEPIAWDSLPGMQTGSVPWTPGLTQLNTRMDEIGLAKLGTEGQVLHIHQNVQVYIDGKKTTVPAQIGIDRVYQFFSPLHTHD